MKILILPLLIIIVPVIILVLIIKGLKKEGQINLLRKVVLGVSFVLIELIATFAAIYQSMNGMADNGIECMNGAITFIPLGIFIILKGLIIIIVSRNQTKID